MTRTVILIVVVAVMLLIPRHWAGILLLYLSGEIVYRDRLIRGDRVLLLITLASIVAHGSVAVIDALWWPLPVLQPDPMTFFAAASRIATDREFRIGIDYVFYQDVLALFQIVGGNSRLLGNSLSVLLFACSCLVYVRLVDILDLSRHRYALMLGFGMLPSAVLLRSMTLRESWELCLFLVGIYCTFSMARGRGGWKMFALLVLSITMLTLFHKALVLYSVVLVPMLYIFIVRERGLRPLAPPRWLPLAAVLVMATGIFYVVVTTDSGWMVVRRVAEGDLLEQIRDYREDVDRIGSPRTAFNVAFDTSSFAAAVRSGMAIYGLYLFAAPGRVGTNAMDVYALFEGMLRIVFLTASIMTLVLRSPPVPRRYAVLLMVIYVSLTFLWAVGTTNYGQAIRHHLLTNWIILLLGFPVLWSAWRRVRKP